MILLLLNPIEADKYLRRLSELLNGERAKVFTGEITTAVQIQMACEKVGINKIITTREDFLRKVLDKKGAKVSNYAGSILTLGDSIEILVINPLEQFYTVPHIPTLTARFLTKFTKPNSWRVSSRFNWKFIEPKYLGQIRDDFSKAFLCGVDIETTPGLRITSISYTLLFPSGNTKSWGMFVRSLEDVKLIRELNWTPVPKVLQNGKYDCAYLFAYSAPLRNYYFDTVNMMHAWYSEFPKDLAFLQAFFIRDAMYWKDLAQSDDPIEQMEYNCRDTWSTVEVAVGWLLEAPDWAKKNYIHKFPQVPICHMMEMRGIKQDVKLVEKYNEQGTKELASKLSSIQAMAGVPSFNPSSPQQTLKLMKVLGYRKPAGGDNKYNKESSNEKEMKKAMLLHPLNERILGTILEYRKERKELGTYLPVGQERKDYRGRILYSINPHGTDTGRDASKEHHFWCGLQIQNITGDGKVKDTFIADEGFEFVEFDFGQAEARGVAYCSGDKRLLENVESSGDFHSLNASAFFGVPYEEIWSDELGKALDKKLRDLSKRVNHGANYNMGAAVLLDTMGEKNVRQAQRILTLPKHWSLIQVCKFLLATYEKTYPDVKTVYYNWIKLQIRKTSKLVGPTGWTRYCFGDPSTSKLALNSYVAHYTQSLNAMILDKAVRLVALKYMWDDRVKLLAKIHDSLLTQIRKDCLETIAQDIASLMTFPTPVTDCRGVERQMLIPVDIKYTGKRWSGKKEEEL